MGAKPLLRARHHHTDRGGDKRPISPKVDWRDPLLHSTHPSFLHGQTCMSAAAVEAVWKLVLACRARRRNALGKPLWAKSRFANGVATCSYSLSTLGTGGYSHQRGSQAWPHIYTTFFWRIGLRLRQRRCWVLTMVAVSMVTVVVIPHASMDATALTDAPVPCRATGGDHRSEIWSPNNMDSAQELHVIEGRS